MRRLLATLTVLLAFAATSCKPNQDATDLRNDITKSSNLPHSFDLHVAAVDAAYSVQGKLEDDLRYSTAVTYPKEALNQGIIKKDTNPGQPMPGMGSRAVLIAPLLHGGEPVGTLALRRAEPGPFTTATTIERTSGRRSCITDSTRQTWTRGNTRSRSARWK